jgi:hypothetical protein
VIARARFRLRCLLRPAIPAGRMGERLTPGEARAFVTVLRGWKQQAPEPAHRHRERP